MWLLKKKNNFKHFYFSKNYFEIIKNSLYLRQNYIFFFSKYTFKQVVGWVNIFFFWLSCLNNINNNKSSIKKTLFRMFERFRNHGKRFYYIFFFELVRHVSKRKWISDNRAAMFYRRERKICLDSSRMHTRHKRTGILKNISVCKTVKFK